MRNDSIRKFGLALGLNRKVVGVKFVFIKEEYDDLEVPEFTAKSTFCAMVGKALSGQITKGHAESFVCQGGPEMLGMSDVSNYVRSGKQFSTFKLYESAAVASKVQHELQFLDQKIYGVVVGALELMEDADVAILLCNCWQMMRVVQGYTYHCGMAKNIGMIGNQGICSDLVSRPFKTNDINVSTLCYGARKHTGAEDSELGTGMPIHIFDDVVRGVLATVNSSMDNNQKKKLLSRLSDPNELGFEIEMGKMYGSYVKDSKYPEYLYKK